MLKSNLSKLDKSDFGSPKKENFSLDNSADFQSSKYVSQADQQKFIGKDKQSEKNLKDMKVEYQKYKNQLNNLVETYKNLKNRVEMEKSRDNSNTNIKSANTAVEEKQVPHNLALMLILISIIIGYMLGKA